MRNSHKNNHFLQKAIVKHFAKNGKVKWINYKTNDGGTFNINNKNQPIAIDNFYSKNIEIDMNNLESEGIKVIRKIAQNAQYEKEIILSRKELITLRFYSLLSSTRTNKLRENIRKKDGDSWFNEAIKKDRRSPKKIQEKQISLILKYWKINKNGWISNLEKEINKPRKWTIELSILSIIHNVKKSRLLIFKFDKLKLMLTETLNFTEQNKLIGGILLHFMPVFPNVGIAFYHNAHYNEMLYNEILSKKEKKYLQSTIFKNDISICRHKVIYKNIKLIEKERIKFFKNKRNNINLKINNFLVLNSKIEKYFSKNDKFIYEVLNEKSEIADSCNAMALVHNKNHILIYQKYSDINDAEIQIKKRKISRIEDYT